jgi:hypothetical protein
MALHAPSAARALATPHMLVVSLATTDLRAELEPRRSGEDNRITIELHRERRRNLDDDFGAADATHVGQAARTLTSLRTGGGLHGADPAPLEGGMAAQVLASLAREV